MVPTDPVVCLSAKIYFFLKAWLFLWVFFRLFLPLQEDRNPNFMGTQKQICGTCSTDTNARLASLCSSWLRAFCFLQVGSQENMVEVKWEEPASLATSFLLFQFSKASLYPVSAAEQFMLHQNLLTSHSLSASVTTTVSKCNTVYCVIQLFLFYFGSCYTSSV